MAIKDAYLLVEGKNDYHVVSALCKRHHLPELFSIKTPEEEPGEAEGVDVLLNIFPLRLREEHLRILGLVLDADDYLEARWQAVRNRLLSRGYLPVPDQLSGDGWVSTQVDLPRVGVWLMPNNQTHGMLEDFVERLIPVRDRLYLKATAVIQEIEQAGLNRYRLPQQHSKALIHTWLAWQDPPGRPMGTAITAHTLNHDAPIALLFVNWLRRLFELPATESPQ